MLTPDRFFGRSEEIAELRRHLIDERARLVILHAMAGCGKSSLAAVFINGFADPSGKLTDLPVAYRAGLGSEFDTIFWWRLTDAPALSELIRELVGQLEGDYPTALPKDAELLSARIISAARQRRVLLVLDNLETILDPDDERTVWRAGYENYRIFLRHICEAACGISILVTTREVPSTVYELRRGSPGVEVVQLDGLDTNAFSSVLNSSGEISSSPATMDWVRERYDGSPLAARILQGYIREVYGGSVDDFRQSQPDIVPEFEDLLNFHFGRLTPMEKEVAYWLAINREPVSIETLEFDLLSVDSRDRLRSTLQHLQARIPLESDRRHFSLQPVLLDYVTLRICTKVGGLFSCSSQEIEKYIARLLANDIATEFENDEFGLLDRVALLKAHTSEHVRRAQSVCVIEPLIRRLVQHAGSPETVHNQLRQILAEFRETAGSRRSYFASNIATLIIGLKGKLEAENLSGLTLIAPYFAGTQIRDVSFENCIFVRPSFTERLGAALALDVSPCGKFGLVGDTLGTIRVWDLASRELTFTAAPHRGWIRTVLFLDSDTAVSAGNDGDICWTCARTGTLLHRASDAHADWINALTRDDDGGFFSAAEDGKVAAWTKGMDVRWEQVLGSELFDLATDLPRGRLLVAAAGGRLCVVSAETGEVQAWFGSQPADLQCLAVDGKGDRIASGDATGHVAVRRGQDFEILTEFSSQVRFARALTFVGGFLAIAGDSSQIRVFDTDHPETPIRTLEGHAAAVRSVRHLVQTNTIISASEDKTIRVWDIKNGAIVDQHIGYSATLWSSHEASDGSLVSGCESGELLIWGPTHGARCRSIRAHSGRIFATRAHPELPLVASAGADCIIRLVDLRMDKVVGEFKGHADWVKRLRFSESGDRLYSSSEDKSVRCWDLRSRKELWRSTAQDGRVTALHVGTDGTIYAGDESGALFRLDPTSGRMIIAYRGHQGKVRSVTTDFGRKRLFTAGEDGCLRIWNLDSGGDPLLTEQVCTRQLWALDYLPLTDSLVGGDDDGMLMRLSCDNGKVLRSVQAHDGPIWDLQPDRMGKRVCLASGDEGASIWGARTLRCARREHAPLPLDGTRFNRAQGLSSGQKQNLASLGATV